MYGYEYDDWPLEPLVEAFETLASRHLQIGERVRVGFDGLVHPVHQRGVVMAWEIQP